MAQPAQPGELPPPGLKSEERLKIKQLIQQLETDPRILPFKDPVDFEGIEPTFHPFPTSFSDFISSLIWSSISESLRSWAVRLSSNRKGTHGPLDNQE